MYATGTGVFRNEHLAIKWYKASADQGHDLAKRNLEIMMCKKDFREYTQIGSLPAEIGQLTTLHTFNLGGCKQLGSSSASTL